MADEFPYNEMWREVLTSGSMLLHTERLLYKLLPSNPRCTMCKAPFAGVGGALLHRLLNIGPSKHNPTMCNMCEKATSRFHGGAEVELTILFADVRGSTQIAQTMSPGDFSKLMDRFYNEATNAVVKTDGLIEKFIGDEVTVWYFRGFAGENYTKKAIESGQILLEATGHREPNGPWLPIGVGIHHGVAFVGVVGSAGVAQMTSLGDTPNTGARLASVAGAGEILISDAAYAAAGVDLGDLEHRELELKGRAEPLGVHVLPVTPEATSKFQGLNEKSVALK